MCLSVPGKIISIQGDMAVVSVGGNEYEASLQLLDDVRVGDYILLHTGFAIQKIDEAEALETLKVFYEFDELNEHIKPKLEE